MKNVIRHTISVFFLFCLVQVQPQNQELGIYEKPDTFLPEYLEFIAEDGNLVNLRSLIDKPTVISLVYYECPGLCNPLMEGIAEVIDRTDMDLGTQYQVFTISFDPGEPISLAIQKKASYAKLIENKDVQNGWRFFTGNQENIDKLLDALGYKVQKQGVDYIHPTAIIVVSPKAKITRYLHGTYFLPFDLKMALTEASKGKSCPAINKILKFCFTYDAQGKKYVFNITKITGILVLLMAASFFLILFLKGRKDKTL